MGGCTHFQCAQLCLCTEHGKHEYPRAAQKGQVRAELQYPAWADGSAQSGAVWARLVLAAWIAIGISAGSSMGRLAEKPGGQSQDLAPLYREPRSNHAQLRTQIPGGRPVVD
ncbi:hypothetical protein NDU88_001596 [Pleurodeles waltl]|uniref:Uncharacterized protein n=1 Tax=Pleurodeles waltl TaxID=8319 RepID=A0AAV7SAI1_PLEWA|nr:hypothetical protein NDU88_001596 [Pleurodeles waltl]